MNDLSNPHKPGTKAAARWERRQQALKEFSQAREIRAEAEKLAKPPASLGDWGLMRTRAWMAQQRRLHQLLKGRKGAPPSVVEAMAAVQEVVTGDPGPDRCAQLAQAGRVEQ